MAIPFCFTHETDWQAGCPGCEWAKPVRAMLNQHVAVFPQCKTWPLCSHGEDGSGVQPTPGAGS